VQLGPIQRQELLHAQAAQQVIIRLSPLNQAVQVVDQVFTQQLLAPPLSQAV